MSKILFENSNIEFIDGDRGKNYPKQEDFSDKGHCMFLSAKNVTSCGFNFDNKVFISSEKDNQLKAGKLKRNDIVITTRGTIGNVAIYDDKVPYNDVRINSGMLILRADSSKLDTKFLYYYLSSKEFKEQVNSLISGSAVPQLPIRDIKKLTLPNITKKQQEKIANIISSFEDRIELNTQINQTLEQIAQALFKSWFVDFDPVRAKVQALSDGLSLEQAELAAMQAISGKTPEELTALSQTQPEHYAELAETAKAFPCEMVEVDGGEVPKGWEVKPLGDLISFVKGKKPKAVSPNQEENMLPHILTSSLEGKYNEFCESNKLITVEYQNTIMLMDGSNSGRVAIGHNGVIGSTLAKINLDNNKLWAIIYQFLKHKEADIQANTTGTTIPHTDKNRVNNYLMTIPNDFLLDKFTELFDNSLLKIISNRNQIISLETIRDLLLPRLLNGEIE